MVGLNKMLAERVNAEDGGLMIELCRLARCLMGNGKLPKSDVLRQFATPGHFSTSWQGGHIARSLHHDFLADKTHPGNEENDHKDYNAEDYPKMLGWGQTLPSRAVGRVAAPIENHISCSRCDEGVLKYGVLAVMKKQRKRREMKT